MQGPVHGGDTDGPVAAGFPDGAVLGQGRIGMGGDLRPQGILLRGPDQRGPSRPGTDVTRAGLRAIAQPATNGGGGGGVLKERSDVSHGMAGIHRGQGSFTDIVGGVRALHDHSLPQRHYFREPL